MKFLRRSLMRILAMIAVLAVAGCMAFPVTISPSSTPILDQTKVTKLGHTTGDAWGVWILGLIPISGSTPAKTARDRAINKLNADALTDVTMDSRMINLEVVYIVNAHVEAEGVKIR